MKTSVMITLIYVTFISRFRQVINGYKCQEFLIMSLAGSIIGILNFAVPFGKVEETISVYIAFIYFYPKELQSYSFITLSECMLSQHLTYHRNNNWYLSNPYLYQCFVSILFKQNPKNNQLTNPRCMSLVE